ncbi:hypothetical protein M409DRAFT_24658 [Zasmidium cellare ATCC 36951]|uniref:Uncharacterized protein n=1 Tax=Zasmidium cellare ATCC 36951 TaxID=1080233 RepID=A0A6A6CIP7_ZASCE|nr:uncharacterized protein M409DRAFT_24658 [Zasmidium cellare ATCC 36951]KAF2165276.1 hypothetical protein M409DRAFT_24658 [Zasmidium cellare ATCC 36951]
MGVFGSKKVFDPAKDIPDLSGKIALVTGGNAGIGAGFVRALAAHNPDSIYLCARTQSSADATAKAVKEKHPKATIDIFSLDLNSLDSVKKCAAEITAKAPRLDYIFLNAGISATSPAVTKEGYETQFGINHIGHALFLQLLMPTILSTKKHHPDADIRILLTSSLAARNFSPKTGLVLPQMKSSASTLHPMARYGHSKLANVLFARKLATLYPSITTTSHHPGTVKSEIWGKATDLKILAAVFSPVVWLTGVDTDVGAETGLWTAFVEKARVRNGAYYEPVGKEVGSEKFSDRSADELWEWTNKELEGHGAKGWPDA